MNFFLKIHSKSIICKHLRKNVRTVTKLFLLDKYHRFLYEEQE